MHLANNHVASGIESKLAVPQGTETTKKTRAASRARCLNQYIKQSIIRQMLNWPREIRSLKSVAHLAGTSESVTTEVIREWMRQAASTTRRPAA